MKAVKGDVDPGVDPHAKFTFENLVVLSRKKCLNTTVSNKYVVVDPKDAQLMALSTRIHNLEESEKLVHSTSCGGGGGSGGNGGGRNIYEEITSTTIYRSGDVTKGPLRGLQH